MKTLTTFSAVLFVLIPLVLSKKQPHILFILADDYGWRDIGYHGSEIKTPTLDRLASEGVKLENYYVQPVCTPTRSQLMSGKYQIHTGLQHDIIWAAQPNCLPTEDPTMADKMREAGYATHMVGKWHLGFYKKECTPMYRGFDSFFGYLTGSENYYNHTRCAALSMDRHPAVGCGTDLHDNERNEDGYKGQYSAHLFTQRAQTIVENHAKQAADKPLFLYVPFQTVHEPLQVPDSYMEPYSHIKDKSRRTYAGMTAVMDEAVKNLTDTFKQLGLWEDTLLVFSTDNGGDITEGGNNWPLRGWKHSLWEGGVRGVSFVTGHGVQAAGSINTGLMHVSDWFPTLVTVAGGNITGVQLDGYNVWDAISSGSASPRKELLHNIDPLSPSLGPPRPGAAFDPRVRAAIRVGDWKLLTGRPGNASCIPPPQMTDDSTLRFKPHQDTNLQRGSDSSTILNVKDDNQNIYLFNIAQDPDERIDLSMQNPDKVQELLDRLAYYNGTAVPVRFPKFDPQSNPELHGGFWQPWQ